MLRRMIGVQRSAKGRIVQLGGGPMPAESQPPTFIKLLASPVGALMVRIPPKPQQMRKMLRGLGHGPSADAGRMDAFITWRVALMRDTDSLSSERDLIRVFVRGEDFRPALTFDDRELEAIKHPTLVVLGTSDPGGTVDTWRRVVATLPRGELHVVDGAGHLSWFDNPNQVGAAVRRFLAA
jgi:pimeloyl-ACP methyl ester carboxylesterase